jgi:pimeloyl-ACP methyl ester carboxylesterase
VLEVAIVDNQGLPIFYEDVGAGPAVVLGHSFLCSGTMWRGQVPALAGRFRVLNLDLRGHGRSGEVVRAFSLDDAVSDVVAVLDHLGIEKAVWCGLSVGGMVALRAALACPQRVGGLVLLDTDAGAETVIRKSRFWAMGLGVRLVGMGPFASSIARLMFGATTRRLDPALVSRWKRDLSEFHVPSVLRVLDALMQRDSLIPRLHQIRVRTLVVVGEEDRSLPPALSRRIHDRLHDSRFVQITAAGHLSALERPAPVTEAILEFLEPQAR